MMHPPQFLQTILARPHDDHPRLQYAAWLDSCHNPLGEFIRLQCLLERPSEEICLDREHRTQELLAEFHVQWSNFVADYVDWYHFRRGFIEEISLGASNLIAHAEELFQLVPLIDLHVTSDGQRLELLPELPTLKHTLFLDISAQPLSDEGVERLADAPLLAQVHGLNLGSCYLGDVGLDALIDSPYLGTLSELYLNDNPLGDDSLRRFVLTPLIEQLQVLDVRDTNVSPEGIEVLKRILGDRLFYSS
jgi:uncharacterized protein (TIGR02996 family)